MDTFGHCDYNGDFTPYGSPSISLWDRSGFFYINVAWGEMDFPTAKFIDIVWDVGIGRAGQALLAWVTFKVSSQYLTATMRERSVSYGTFEALAFVPPTLVRTGRLAGDLLANRGWRTRLTMVWIICSSLFVISFSSLATAMSGYSSNNEAVMPDYTGRVVGYADYQVVHFAINDAWRIGEPEPVTVTVGNACVWQGIGSEDDNTDEATQGADAYNSRDIDTEDDEDPFEYVPSSCTMFWRSVQYVDLYGVGGSKLSPSTFIWNGIKHNLTSPTLNITTSYTPSSLLLLSNYLDNFSSQPPSALKSVGKVSESTFWIYDNQTYSFDYVLDHATCQYMHSHNWGFSFLLLFTTTLLLAIWAIGTYALWLSVDLRSSPRWDGHDVGRRSDTGSRGIYRSSWELVEAMKRDMGHDVVQSGMSEKEIRSLVRRRRRDVGGSVPGLGSACDAHFLQQQSDMKAEEGTFQAYWLAQSPVPCQTPWKKVRPWLHWLRLDAEESIRRPRHANATRSTTSQDMSLISPSTLGTTTSSLTSASPSSVFTFSNQLTAEQDMLAEPGSDTVNGRRNEPRLSRLNSIGSRVDHVRGQSQGRSISAASQGTWWLTPASASDSGASSMFATLVADADTLISGTNGHSTGGEGQDIAAQRKDGDVVEFMYDLGDD
nr:hypothetical protein LTR18_003988 [Exophiala xenobiotica]